MRIVQGRQLLRPSEALNEEILGVLGRALYLYSVLVHAFVFMSNHVHMILTVPDANVQACFLRHLNKNVGDAIRRQTGWTGAVWDGRPSVDVITTDEKARERLQYVLSNGVKEGLVATPTEWPGVSSARALLEQSEIVGAWTGREGRRAARRGVARKTEYRFELAPLPFMAGMSRDERRSFFENLFRDIAIAGASSRGGRPPAGAQGVRRANPFRPIPLEKHPAPIVYGSPETRARFLADRKAFISWYRDASHRLARGEPDVEFPPGSFPPRRPFVPWPTMPQR